jgi:integrase
MGRKVDHIEAPGIYRKNGKEDLNSVCWLRYTVDGQQIRRSLGTRVWSEAIEIAEKLRGEKTEKVRELWLVEVEKYLKFKSGGDNPKFSRFTVDTVRRTCRTFGEYAKVAKPTDVTPGFLRKYYEARRKEVCKDNKGREKMRYSEGTVRSHIKIVSAFLKWCGVNTNKVDFFGVLNTRPRVIDKQTVMRIISRCESVDLRFVLYAGFTAGMRKNEIANSKPHWFDLDAHEIHIPASDGDFKTKSGRGRCIPLHPAFEHFLRTTGIACNVYNPDPDAFNPDYVAHDNTRNPRVMDARFADIGTPAWNKLIAGGKRYRWDFYARFRSYMAKERIVCTPHTMRHTYISLMARSGTPIAQLMEWSGDRIKTLEYYYLHSDTDVKRVIDVFGGIDAFRPVTPEEFKAEKEAAAKLAAERLEEQRASPGSFWLFDTAHPAGGYLGCPASLGLCESRRLGGQ